MSSTEIIERTANHVRTALSADGTGHDWWHVYRVWKMAQRIGQAEKAALLVVELAALLHDIADWKLHGGDSSVGPKMAKDWLDSLDLDPAITNTFARSSPGFPSREQPSNSQRSRWKEESSKTPTAWMRSEPLALPEPSPTGEPRGGRFMIRPSSPLNIAPPRHI